MVELALLPEPRPKARNLPTRYGARDVGAQANRIRRAGPALCRQVDWRRRLGGPQSPGALPLSGPTRRRRAAILPVSCGRAG